MLTEQEESVTAGDGMSPAAGLREALERIGVSDATRVRVETPDLNGILRGKYIALEKLEEHTLYILQLHRRIAALEARAR